MERGYWIGGSLLHLTSRILLVFFLLVRLGCLDWHSLSSIASMKSIEPIIGASILIINTVVPRFIEGLKQSGQRKGMKNFEQERPLLRIFVSESAFHRPRTGCHASRRKWNLCWISGNEAKAEVKVGDNETSYVHNMYKPPKSITT